ncbi:MAG: serine/threonine protein kinase [Planctomycetota bacterium]|jgi:tetratricopeptide (TPR) repeat protein
MNDDRFQRLMDIVADALDRAPADRERFIDEACGHDGELSDRVRRLLANEQKADSYFAAPIAVACPATAMAGETGPSPERIGDYEIRRRIASGGMGTVYEAAQAHPRRLVALKVLRQGVASREALRRFRHEAEILGRLRHPNVAQVFEAGTHDDGTGAVPFFAMEYVPNAKAITEYVSDEHLDVRQRLTLFIRICDAVQHGHLKGVIHRDLKPSNILVDSDGAPKIIDFGVARTTDSDIAITTLQTDLGQLIGTLQYMSPEQCGPEPYDLDARSDVYALGIVLYEVLCGALPYDVSRASIVDAARVIRERAPTKPSSINRRLRGDLETIVLKAMDKDRNLRYQSAAELAADIERYLNDEAIVARPPSAIYQLRTFTRRNKRLVGGLATLALILVASTVVSVNYALRAAEQREVAQAINEFLNQDLLAAAVPSAEPGKGRDVLMREVLDAAAERIDEAAGPGGRFAEKPLIVASIRLTMGNAYRLLGELDTAEPHLVRALGLRRRELGDAHRDTLLAMNGLAELYRHQERFREAQSLLEHMREAYTRELGDEHPDTVGTMHNLANVHRYQKRCDEAEALAVRVLEIRRRDLGDEDRYTLATMNLVGLIWSCQGRIKEAEAMHLETLETMERVLGEEDLLTVFSLQNLAGVYVRQERPDEAEPLFRRAIEILERVQGPAHRRTIECKEQFAAALELCGRREAALAVRRELLHVPSSAAQENGTVQR